MDVKNRAFLELHIAILLFGFTAILGKWISLNAFPLVWWRVLITSISFFFVINIPKLIRTLPWSTWRQFLLIGIIVAAHWVTFYGAIKLSNASIALITLATTSFMTSIVEPIILKRKVLWYEVGLGLLILPGMLLIISQTDFSYRIGILVGLISAFLACLFSVLNKKFIEDAKPKEISAIEMFGATGFLTLMIPIVFYFEPNMQWWPEPNDWFYLLLLSLLCTTLAYVLATKALKHISAFQSNLAINLEPVYGIVLAIVLLKEHNELTPQFYIGVVIIILAVFCYPFIKRWNKKKIKLDRP